MHSTSSTAAAVGNAFLHLYRNDPSVPFIDQMKLQKLIFYSHAWYLGINSKDLFPEDIHAWPWGPVVPDIYSQTSVYGRLPVTEFLRSMDSKGSWHVPVIADESIKAHINSIWNTHKHFTGIQLSNSTHETGEPWQIVFSSYSGDLSAKPVIPNALIQEVFRNKINAA